MHHDLRCKCSDPSTVLWAVSTCWEGISLESRHITDACASVGLPPQVHVWEKERTAIPWEEQRGILIILVIIRGWSRRNLEFNASLGCTVNAERSRKWLHLALHSSVIHTDLLELRKASDHFIRSSSLSQDSSKLQAFSAQANFSPFRHPNYLCSAYSGVASGHFYINRDVKANGVTASSEILA